MPFFSVIVPTYNRAPLLRKLLVSLAAQAFGDFEVLVVDDGGTDNSESVVASFSDPRFSYFRKANGGVSSARNFGLERATGEVINFFDSDDLAYPNHLLEAHQFFNNQPDAGVVIFDYEWGDTEKRQYKRISNRYADLNREILYHNYISTNSILIRKNYAMQLRFCEALRVSEDWDYWIRLSALTRFYSVPVTTSYIIEHEERGLKKIDPVSLLTQKQNFITSLQQDERLGAVPGFRLKTIVSHFDSFIALNLALAGKKSKAIWFFMRSVFLYPSSIFSKRALAIIKHILFTW